MVLEIDRWVQVKFDMSTTLKIMLTYITLCYIIQCHTKETEVAFQANNVQINNVVEKCLQRTTLYRNSC